MYSFTFLKNRKWILLLIVISFALLALFFLRFPLQKKDSEASADILLRSNQLGLSPNEKHQVLLLKNKKTQFSKIRILDANLKPISDISVSFRDQVFSWDSTFFEVPPLAPGNYYFLPENSEEKHLFRVQKNASADLLLKTLNFFRQQRCGLDVEIHQACHRKSVRDQSEQIVTQDVLGGWHDAGDYIRFFLTTSYATVLLLESLEWAPKEVHARILSEAQWGVDWLNRMWGYSDRPHFMQIGDKTDHDRWRLPEVDDDSTYEQKVYEMEPKRGANLAGRLVVSLVLLSIYDTTQEKGASLERAENIFAQALKLTLGSQSTADDFYKETVWMDDMALAAIELYAVTKNPKYKKYALDYLTRMQPFWSFSYAEIHPLVYYRAAKVFPHLKSQAVRHLKSSLERNWKSYVQSPRKLSLKKFYWGSQLEVMGVVIQSMLYERLTLDKSYRAMAIDHWDYTFGRNPWGLSMMSGAGEKWLQHPHHQIAQLKKLDLSGYWAPGAVDKEIWLEQNMNINKDSDPLRTFQPDDLIQTSDWRDYVTNEPTLTSAATGFFMLSVMF